MSELEVSFALSNSCPSTQRCSFREGFRSYSSGCRSYGKVRIVVWWEISSHIPCRSVADLELISRVIFGAPSTDNAVPPLPFREASLPKKMKFGYYTWGIEHSSPRLIIPSDIFQTSTSKPRQHVRGLFWKPWKLFVQLAMNVWNLNSPTVSMFEHLINRFCSAQLLIASSASAIFVALTSADGYKTLLSQLGPDKKVPISLLHCFQADLYIGNLLIFDHSWSCITL